MSKQNNSQQNNMVRNRSFQKSTQHSISTLNRSLRKIFKRNDTSKQNNSNSAQNGTQQNATGHNNSLRDNTPQNNSSQNSSLQNTSTLDTISENTSVQNTSSGSIALQDLSLNDSFQNISIHNTSLHNTSCAQLLSESSGYCSSFFEELSPERDADRLSMSDASSDTDDDHDLSLDQIKLSPKPKKLSSYPNKLSSDPNKLSSDLIDVDDMAWDHLVKIDNTEKEEQMQTVSPEGDTDSSEDSTVPPEGDTDSLEDSTVSPEGDNDSLEDSPPQETWDHLVKIDDTEKYEQLQTVSPEGDADSSEASPPQEHMQEDSSTKRKNTARNVIEEIQATEKSYLTMVNLLNQHYRQHQTHGLTFGEQTYRQTQIVLDILSHLPAIKVVTQNILDAITKRLENWEKNPTAADIFVTWGPSLIIYSTYIIAYEAKLTAFKQARMNDQKFDKWTRFFEEQWSEQLMNLSMADQLCTPVQHLPRYRLLLTEYSKHLPQDSREYETTMKALKILHEVNKEVNGAVREQMAQERLESLADGRISDFQAFKEGRSLIKEGQLFKVTRRRLVPRWFFLFNDALICTTLTDCRYQINQFLQISGLQVSIPATENYPHEFTVTSEEASLTLSATNAAEKADWLSNIKDCIDEFEKRSTTEQLARTATCLVAPIYQHIFKDMHQVYETSTPKQPTKDIEPWETDKMKEEHAGYMKIMHCGTWYEKWFLLKKNWLHITTSPGDDDEEQYPLKGSDVQEIEEWYENNQLKWVFTLGRGNSVRLIFKVDSSETRDMWVAALRKAADIGHRSMEEILIQEML